MATGESKMTEMSTPPAEEEKPKKNQNGETTEANQEDIHPLEHTWTLWYDAPPKIKQDPSNWRSNVTSVASFQTVEDFWSLFNNLVPPSDLAMKSNYNLFKEGIKPEWEDPTNSAGGKFVIEISDTDQLGKTWLNVCLALIGEAFDDYNEICGAVVSVRGRRSRIAIWTKNAKNVQARDRIGSVLLQVTDVRPNKLVYQVHADAIKRYTA